MDENPEPRPKEEAVTSGQEVVPSGQEVVPSDQGVGPSDQQVVPSKQEVVSSNQDPINSENATVDTKLVQVVVEPSHIGSTQQSESPTKAKTPEPKSSEKVIDKPQNELIELSKKIEFSKSSPKKSENDVSSKPDVKGEIITRIINPSNAEELNEKKTVPDTYSVTENTSELTEKEHNKSISRELKSLIDSAKESKIISECNQLKTKIRKSRVHDTLNTSLNSSHEADKIQGNRRGSNNSQISNSSEKSEKALTRSMRSQNPEFVNKHKQFLNSVTGKVNKDESMSEDSGDDSKSFQNDSISKTPKKKKISIVKPPENTSKLRVDPYCWRCHWSIEQVHNEKHPAQCTVCPRSFHFKCLNSNEKTKFSIDKSWVCPECLTILHVENSENRSQTLKKISLGALCELLKYALERMCDVNGVEPFTCPVDRTAFPDYDKYVVHPMDLNMIKENIDAASYGSTEAFVSDTQWILHNSIIFNTLQSKLTAAARALVRSCRAEMGEIEACPECYAAAHARRPTWFTDVCSTPHILLWAKLKGFPYWPAKGMSINNAGHVDVRFFGAHDRAWVAPRDCFLYSLKDPNNFRTKRQDILDSMEEAEDHIRNIARKFGSFVHATFKTVFDPTKLNEQLKMMIPGFQGEVISQKPTNEKQTSSNASPAAVKEKRRSHSKSSKDFYADGDVSDEEDPLIVPQRKMADGAEIAREESDSGPRCKRAKSMDVNTLEDEEENKSRKRRRSVLEEAVITVLDTTAEKRKRSSSPLPTLFENTSTTKTPKQRSESRKDPTRPVRNSKDTTDKAQSSPKVTIADNSKPLPSKTSEGIKETVPPVVLNIKNANSKGKTPIVKVVNKDSPKAKQQSEGPFKISVLKNVMKSIKVRRLSKANRSLTPAKSDGSNENKDVSDDVDSNKGNSSNTSITASNPNNDENNKSITIKTTSTPKSTNEKLPTKSSKDKIIFDESNISILSDKSDANIVVSVPGFPTISNVRSLSTTKPSNKTIDSPTVTPSNSNTSTPLGSDSGKDTASRSQSLRNTTASRRNSVSMSRRDTPSTSRRNSVTPTGGAAVGRLGVRAFARIKSPPAEKPPAPKSAESVEVEVKAEPMEFDDAERQAEKVEMLNSVKLRPVNQTQNLREIRINKVTSLGPARGAAPKPPEIRPRAKKTFPQPKKPEEGRSELNGKNSMVYIPIQPPTTTAPVRPAARPPSRANGPTNNSQQFLLRAPNLVNSVVTTSVNMLSPVATPALLPPAPTPAPALLAAPAAPTIVPTSVHTVPYITSVNGQWTLSLQPMMSVGNIESPQALPAPLVNGVAERPAPPAPAPAPPLSIADNEATSPGELPRLQQRPPLLNPLDPATPIGEMPTPSSAGEVTAKLNQNAVKLADFFRNLLEDSIEKLENPSAHLTLLKLQLEHTRWEHQQQLNEVKHNNDLMLAEIRASVEKEKLRLISETRRTCQMELETAVQHAKTKQWCANCRQEAQFYCCWNTSYCDYPCQRAHWAQHFAVCAQQRSQDNSGDNRNSLDNRLQPPEVIPKTSATITVGGKTVPARVLNNQISATPKSALILSTIEESSGNSSVKCVGSYKPQQQSILLNKQIMNAEENSKKVVTSGGYFIVGSSPPKNTSVTLN